MHSTVAAIICSVLCEETGCKTKKLKPQRQFVVNAHDVYGRNVLMLSEMTYKCRSMSLKMVENQ